MVLLKAALNTLPSARGPCYRAIMGSELAPVTWNILESLIESLEIHGETELMLDLMMESRSISVSSYIHMDSKY